MGQNLNLQVLKHLKLNSCERGNSYVVGDKNGISVRKPWKSHYKTLLSYGSIIALCFLESCWKTNKTQDLP